MILSDVQTRVKNQFGDTSGAVITDADIARWASDAELEIARKTKCTEAVTTVASVSGTAVIPILDALSVSEVRWNGLSLKHFTRQQLNNLYPNRSVAGYFQGTPTAFFLDETGLTLFPTPDSTGDSIRVLYAKRPPPVVNVGDSFTIPEEYHEDIVVRCLQRAYETDGQWPAADRKQAEFTAKVNETAYDTKNKDDDSYPAVRVLPGDYGDAW